MKTLITIPAMLLALFTNAQELNTIETDTAVMQRRNIIKTNLTAYAFKNINVTYERSINRWFSVSAGYSVMPDGKIPFIKSFTDADDELRDVKAGSTHFTIETRFYLGKGYGKGFYAAPYYRNSTFKTSNFTYYQEYEDGAGNTTEIPLNISGKATGNSVGLLLGVQFFLNKKGSFVLDWWIVGAHYGKGKGDFTGKSSQTLTPDQQSQLKAELEDLGIPLVEYSVQTNTNGAAIKLDGPWAGLRSGLSLGYRF